MKVEFPRYRPGVAQRVGRGIALLFHNRGTRRWVSGQQHAPAALYPQERPGTHCTGGWVGPRAGLDVRKISSPPGFDPRTVQPVVSRYSDWATGPTLIRMYAVKNTTVCLVRCYILNIKKKLHVSASSGHHQVFCQNIKIVLYNSRDDVLKKRSRHQTTAGIKYPYTGCVGETQK